MPSVLTPPPPRPRLPDYSILNFHRLHYGTQEASHSVLEISHKDTEVSVNYSQPSKEFGGERHIENICFQPPSFLGVCYFFLPNRGRTFTALPFPVWQKLPSGPSSFFLSTFVSPACPPARPPTPSKRLRQKCQRKKTG